ncbi:hypothetical protein HII36_31795 [Nonomuraea sp. NN258]|uniref:hypothetical protein n=1 Tax=Nonomuraea antri TaxID=2730852 RepID=UPI0015681215|nr:hypothetical protein [Nonomuraea antri]NRQ36385.1 hypothetical protein [Nonomuraea antri]
MNAGQPTTADLRESYAEVSYVHQTGLGWTAVVPDDGRPLTLEQIAARLAGDAPYEIHEPAPLSAVVPPDFDAYPVLVGWYGATTVLFEFGAVWPDTLGRLSRDARAYGVRWNVNAVNALSFAAGGELVLSVDALFPARQEAHPGLARWPELRATTDFFHSSDEPDEDDDEDDGSHWRDGYDWRAACLTVIEQTTGARLTLGWEQRPRPYVTFRLSDAT